MKTQNNVTMEGGEAAHTLLPYAVEENDGEGRILIVSVASNDRDRDIAEIIVEDPEDDAERTAALARAAFIVRCVKTHEALVVALSECEADYEAAVECSEFAREKARAKEKLERVRAALKSATA